MKAIRSWSLLMLYLLAIQVQAQSTSLRQESINEGDIAELTITHDAGIPSLFALDTTPLNADFEVLDTRSRISRVTQDNQARHRMEWNVYLVPRRHGRLHIPALRFGNYSSAELWLEVEPSDAARVATQHAFLELEAKPDNPYPGQQVRIVMRLLHNFDKLDGSLFEPKIDAAGVYRGGLDLSYEATRNDETYAVLERSILITPEAAGQLTIPAVTFRGSLDLPTATVLNNGAATKRHIYRRSEPLHLQVRDIPSGLNEQAWLPASALQLEVEWDDTQTSPRVGDSLGVNLTLTASGIAASTLPADLLLRDSGQLRLFADRESRNTRVEHSSRNLQLQAILQQRFVVVLDRAGEVTLPQLELDWWDVSEDSPRRATIPATSLQVAPAQASFARIDQAGSLQQADTSQARASLTLALPGTWFWIVGLISVILLALLSRGLRRYLQDRLERIRAFRNSRNRLHLACLANDATAAHPALIQWARLHWHEHRIYGLQQIKILASSPEWGVTAVATRCRALFRKSGGLARPGIVAPGETAKAEQTAKNQVIATPRTIPGACRRRFYSCSNCQPLDGLKRSPNCDSNCAIDSTSVSIPSLRL